MHGLIRKTSIPVFLLFPVLLTVVTRLIFLGWMQLLPEEAYYWNYAQHLDFGYLDHPPMVSWLIWLSTSILGNNEFGVRLPAFLSWFAFVYFMFRFSADLIGRMTARWALIPIAVLPIYFSIGFLMTPDAPMYLAWAACLYFLKEGLLTGKRKAWYWFGVALGLGLLSKYSIGLLGLSAVSFMLLDKESRVWWKRVEPYVALLISLIIFSPVVYWNYGHEWVSFIFQSGRRWTAAFHFSPHLLFGGIIVLLTPIGLVTVIRAFIKKYELTNNDEDAVPDGTRARRFMLTFTLIPLLVFVAFSLRGEPKLNWTGPIWLAVIPLLTLELKNSFASTGDGVAAYRRAWHATIIFLPALYLGGMGYISCGMPGLTTSQLSVPTAWKEFYTKTHSIETEVEARLKQELLVVGMDKYWINSELAFYGAGHGDSLVKNAGRILFDENSLMWNYWVSKSKILGRNVIIISFDRNDLQKTGVVTRFDQISPINEEFVYRGGRVKGQFYWRVGYRYRN